MGYNYTFVIPHKNTPALLAKCLDTIPQRDAVQVIVVDDNSDPSIVDFDNFPGLKRKNTIVVFDKSGKGAGNARNVALDRIVDTKWLVFADADDYFTPYLCEALDKYADSCYDMVYFNRHSVYLGTDEPARRHQVANTRIKYALSTGDTNIIRYKDLAPVCKFVSYKLVRENKVRFESIPFSNDVMFFLRVGCLSNSIRIDANVIYVVTDREGSLMKTCSKESHECRYLTAVRAVKLMKSFGVEQYHPNLFAYISGFLKVDKLLAVKCFFVSLKHTPVKYWAKDLCTCFRAVFEGDVRIA